MPVLDPILRRKLQLLGHDPDNADLVDENKGQPTVASTNRPQPDHTSALGAAGRGFATGILPTAFGLGVGALVGGATAPFIGPGSIPVGISAGLGTSLLTGYGQNQLINLLSPKLAQNLAYDIKEHPVATTAGGLAAALPALKPSPKAVVSAGRGIGQMLRGGAPRAEDLGSVLNVGLGAGMGAGQSLIEDLRDEEKGVNVPRLILSTAGGGLLNDPTKLGQRFLGLTPNKYYNPIRYNNEGNPIVEYPPKTLEVNAPINEIPVNRAITPEDFIKRTILSPSIEKRNKRGILQKVIPLKSAEESAAIIANPPKTGTIDYELGLKEKAEQDLAQVAELAKQTKAQEEQAVAIGKKQMRQALPAEERPLTENQLEIIQSSLKQQIEQGQIGRAPERIQAGETKKAEEALPEIIKAIKGNIEEVNEQLQPEVPKVKKEPAKLPEDLTKPLTEAEQIQEEYDKGIREQKTKQVSTTPTESWAKSLEQLGIERGVKIELDGSIADNEGNPVAGKTWLRQKLQQTLAKVNPYKAGLDTWPHELFHNFYEDLKTGPSKTGQKIAIKGEEIITKNSEFLEAQKANPSLTPEEFLTSKVGVDFIRRALGTDKKGDFANWSSDFWSFVKTKFGKGTDADYVRLLSNKLMNDATFEQTHLKPGEGIKTIGKDFNEEEKGVKFQDQDQLKEAPVIYQGYQEGAGDIEGFHLYNLKETISPTLIKGSTVTEASLNRNGFKIPENVRPTTKFQKEPAIPQTPEFKKWFEGSKVVDKEGKPLVVYHGTPKGGFNVFDTQRKGYQFGQGAYFTPGKAHAKGYMSKNKPRSDEIDFTTPQLYDTYLSLKNPYYIKSDAEIMDLGLKLNQENKVEWDRLAKKVAKDMGYTHSVEGVGTAEVGNYYLREKGYDGIIREWKKGEPSEIVAFYPEQIKSASKNIGTYNANSSDIRYQSFPAISTGEKLKSTKDYVTFPGVRSAVEALREYKVADNPQVTQDAHFVADKVEQTYRDITRHTGTYVNGIVRPLKQLLDIKFGFTRNYLQQDSPAANSVRDYLDQVADTGKSNIQLTANEKQAVDLIRTYNKKVLDERNIRKGLHYGGSDPNYFQQVPSRDAIDTLLNNPKSAKAITLLNDFRSYHKELGDTQVNDVLQKFLNGYNKQGGVNIAKQFGPLDESAGIGIPPSWREKNLINRLARYGERVARRFAYHDNLQGDVNPEVIKSMESLPVNKLRPILEDIGGIKNKSEMYRDAISGIVRAGMLGTLTGSKDFATNFILGAQHLTPTQLVTSAVDSFKNMNENLAASFKMGVNRDNIMSLEMGENGWGDMLQWLGRFRDIASDIQGRNFLERITRAVAFGQGKYVAMDNLLKAKQGNLSNQEKKFLEDFTPERNWEQYKTKGEFPLEVLNEIAARYVESVQGTYDLRGLPLFATKGSLSPVFALARWNVEKFNNFMKYVVTPAYKDKNYTPLLMQTLAMFIGGEAVTKIVELSSGRKEKTAKPKEILAASEMGFNVVPDVAYKMAGLVSAAGYAGMAGDTVRYLFDKMYGKNRAQTYNNVMIEAAENLQDTIIDFFDALEKGEGVDVILPTISKIIEDNLQAYRIAINNLSPERKQDIERSNKFRDLRVFNILAGNPIADLTEKSTSNPLVGRDVKKFKRTGDLNEAAQLLPGLIKDVVDKSKGDPEKILTGLRGLKINNYQIMPNPEEHPFSFKKYYDYLVLTKGEEEANKVFADYITQNTINQAKSQMLQ